MSAYSIAQTEQALGRQPSVPATKARTRFVAAAVNLLRGKLRNLRFPESPVALGVGLWTSCVLGWAINVVLTGQSF